MTTFDATQHPPQNLNIEITTECNLRCKQCHLWMTREEPTSLSTREKEGLIEQLHALNPRGRVMLSGGETMSKLEEFFSLSKLCRTLGLRCAAVTNGTFINDATFERLLVDGPHALTISLDSHKPEVHDFIRGVKGSYGQVVAAIQGLTRLKAEQFPDTNTTICTQSIVFDRNIELCEAYIEFARNELRVDGVLFQMLSPTFANQGKHDPFFEKHFVPDPVRAKEVIDRVIRLAESDGFVRMNPADLEWMKLFIDDPDFVGAQVCDSHERNIMVDQYGDVQLCFSMKEHITNGKAIGNVRRQSLAELWIDDTSNQARAMMASCRKSCGMLTCHRRAPQQRSGVPALVGPAVATRLPLAMMPSLRRS